MSLILIFGAAVMANALGTILIKVGSSKMPSIELSWQSGINLIKNLYILSGVAFYIASFPAYSFILQKLNVSSAFPIFASLSFVLVVLVSFFFLKEQINFWQIFGLSLIILGIILLARGRV